ncbi:MAG: hypothetical protein EBT70_17340, partial [Betaproteobacteria bacterium]|nr:hypothetical protein [Betaproteobacteria bacterium]
SATGSAPNLTQEVSNDASLDQMWGENASITPTYQATDAVLSYDASTRRWGLSLPSGVLNESGVYDVQVGVKAKGDVLRLDSGLNELTVQTAAPTLTFDEVSADGYMNATEHNAELLLSGSAYAPQPQNASVNTAVGGSVHLRVLDATNASVAELDAPVYPTSKWFAFLPISVVQGLAQGSYTVNASLVSIYGNTASVTMPLVVDTTPPDLTLEPVLDSALTANQASAWSLAYTTSDNMSVNVTRQFSVTRAQGPLQSAVNFTDTGHQVSADLSGLGEGAYQFNITSLDGAGNATRQSVDLLIDKTAPTITLTRKNPSPVGQGNADVGFVVDLSEPMLGLSESDISLTNASLLSWTPVAN